MAAALRSKASSFHQVSARCIVGALLPSALLASGPPQFTDRTVDAGVSLTHQTSQTITALADAGMNAITPIAEMNSNSQLFSSWLTGGVAVGDVNSDGRPDIFALGGDLGQAKLFQNDGDGTFTDVSMAYGIDAISGRASGAVFADYDGDSDIDLFIGGALGQSPRLLRNDGGSFTDVFALAMTGYEISASPNAWGGAFGDFDGDRCLDLLIPRSMTPAGPTPTLKTAAGSTQQLWRNNCAGGFIDASLTAGIAQLFDPATFPDEGRDQTFTGNFSDIDQDGDVDILMTGDISTSLILRNNGDGTFSDITDRLVIDDFNAMGGAVGDVDNDGLMDWFSSNIGGNPPGNRLYLGNGDGTFVNAGAAGEISDGHWGWGSCLIDVNMDRLLDIFHVNGFYFPGNDNPDVAHGRYDDAPAVLFVANGDGSYTERAAEFGLNDIGEGRGVSCFDYDRDGDMDVAISNHKGPFKLYGNNIDPTVRGFLNVSLQGLTPNTQGIGASVRVRSEHPMENGELIREIRAGNNFQSANLPEAVFALGGWVGPFTISVDWPLDGVSYDLIGVSRNQFLQIVERRQLISANGFESP